MAKKPFPFSVCEQCCVESGGSGGTITLDTEMSDTSENAVQNKVIKGYVDEETKKVADYAANVSSGVDNRLTDAMFLMEERINGRLALKADKSTIVNVTEPTYNFQFYDLYNMEVRAKTLESISFNFSENEYSPLYEAGLCFDSGETPTNVDYVVPKNPDYVQVVNWVGVDCISSSYVNSDGQTIQISVFQPSANTHYDIVFYFNGTQFIGLVNGFVPASGNVVSG